MSLFKAQMHERQGAQSVVCRAERLGGTCKCRDAFARGPRIGLTAVGEQPLSATDHAPRKDQPFPPRDGLKEVTFVLTQKEPTADRGRCEPEQYAPEQALTEWHGPW